MYIREMLVKTSPVLLCKILGIKYEDNLVKFTISAKLYTYTLIWYLCIVGLLGWDTIMCTILPTCKTSQTQCVPSSMFLLCLRYLKKKKKKIVYTKLR